jgi:hypothetical protein
MSIFVPREAQFMLEPPPFETSFSAMSAHYELISTLPSVAAVPGCLAFSPNGKILASCSPGRPLLLSSCEDGSAVADVTSGERIHVLAWNILEKQELICGFESGAIAFLRLTDDKVRVISPRILGPLSYSNISEYAYSDCHSSARWRCVSYCYKSFWASDCYGWDEGECEALAETLRGR